MSDITIPTGMTRAQLLECYRMASIASDVLYGRKNDHEIMERGGWGAAKSLHREWESRANSILGTARAVLESCGFQVRDAEQAHALVIELARKAGVW